MTSTPASASPGQPATAPTTVEDFFRTDLRVGRIVRAEDFPKARKPAYQLWIDFGELGVKRSSAQITARYTAEELIGRTVVAATNFPPRRIAGFMSEVLVLGVPVPGTDEVVLLAPDADVPLGARISLPKLPGKARPFRRRGRQGRYVLCRKVVCMSASTAAS